MRPATTLLASLEAAGAACGTLAPAGTGRADPLHPQLWHADDWQQAGAQAQAACTPSGFAALDRELPGGGWPQGQLVELLVDQPGSGELSLLLPALAAVSRAGRSCVWVLPCQAPAPGTASAAANAAAPALPAQALPYAPALQDAGIDLARNIFVRPITSRESAWALEQSLRASHLGAALGWLPEGSSEADFRCLRRLHLLAQRHQALVFVLRSSRHAQAPSPAALRLQLRDDGGGQLQLRVLKRRGRPLLEPLCLQVHPAHWNRPAVPATLPAARPRQGAAATLIERVRALAPDPAWGMQALLGH